MAPKDGDCSAHFDRNVDVINSDELEGRKRKRRSEVFVDKEF
jgi:hypothetical protein